MDTKPETLTAATQKPAFKREEIVVCASCFYSTDLYNFDGICDRCLRAEVYFGGVGFPIILHQMMWKKRKSSQNFRQIFARVPFWAERLLFGQDCLVRQSRMQSNRIGWLSGKKSRMRPNQNALRRNDTRERDRASSEREGGGRVQSPAFA